MHLQLPSKVLIRGDGVAARCCAHLLRQAGYEISFETVDRPRIPAIMLSDAAQGLIRDIFQKDDLFRDLPRIEKRIVAWGPGAAPVELNHSAVVVSEDFLLRSLESPEEIGSGPADWTIYAAPPLPASTAHRFGSRMASAVAVEMKGATNTCWIESLDDGWLFLNSGWLLSVGPCLGKSRLVREQIAGFDAPAGEFPASPRMVAPLGGSRWISCGTAAMAFDPLCGDGTAHAVREAILASAVIRAADGGEDAMDLLSHYEARLTAGFQRHLVQCREYYSSGGNGDWWRAEAEPIAQGLEWCARRLAGFGEFRFQLIGLELGRL
jgi:hypothetical protein